MRYYLLKLDKDYADEFNVCAFQICTEEEWVEGRDKTDEFLTKYFNNNDEYELYFGTNEALQWSSMKHYWQDIVVSEITEEEYNTLYRLFGKSWGMGSSFFPLSEEEY